MFKKSFLMYLLVSVILALLILAIGFSLYINQPVSEQTESPVVTGQTTYQCMDDHTVEAVFMTQGPIPESSLGNHQFLMLWCRLVLMVQQRSCFHMLFQLMVHDMRTLMSHLSFGVKVMERWCFKMIKKISFKIVLW